MTKGKFQFITKICERLQTYSKVLFPFISSKPHSNIIPPLTASVLSPDGPFHKETLIYVDRNEQQ